MLLMDTESSQRSPMGAQETWTILRALDMMGGEGRGCLSPRLCIPHFLANRVLDWVEAQPAHPQSLEFPPDTGNHSHPGLLYQALISSASLASSAGRSAAETSRMKATLLPISFLLGHTQNAWSFFSPPVTVRRQPRGGRRAHRGSEEERGTWLNPLRCPVERGHQQNHKPANSLCLEPLPC